MCENVNVCSLQVINISACSRAWSVGSMIQLRECVDLVENVGYDKGATPDTQRTTGTGRCNDINFITDEEMETKTNETTTLWKRERSSEGGKIKGLASHGKYGHASSYPGQRNKR